MGRSLRPVHVLQEVQIAVARGHYVLHDDVMRSLCRRLLTRADVEACIAALDVADYAGPYPALLRPEERDDLYRSWYRGRRVAVRFGIDAAYGVIISGFKCDGTQ